jgi:hypothetical protein
MTARDSARRKCLLQDSRSVIRRPAPAAHRAVDNLKAPDLALRLKPMVKSRHKTILQKDRHRASSGALKEGAVGAPLPAFEQIRASKGCARKPSGTREEWERV